MCILPQGPKGNWWVCPDFGYDMVVCHDCEGPPMRCKSHYNLFFRCACADAAQLAFERSS
jgi:hypothetical protein